MDFLQNYRGYIAAAVAGPVIALGIGKYVKDKGWWHDLCGRFMKEIEPAKLEKNLCHKDRFLIDVLNSPQHFKDAWVVTDPDLPDNPIIYASAAFCAITGYNKSEIIGRNCRFLQGENSDAGEVAKMHDATQKATETSVCVMNYRKDGTPFFNQIIISPLLTTEGAVSYYLGVTTKVSKVEKSGKKQEEVAKK